jgi:hypothetical protein
LKRLGRGFFAFPNDTLDASLTIGVLAHHFPGLHIGGKTALAWHGILHNVPVRETLFIWGKRKDELPKWFTERFPVSFTGRQLFDEKLPANFAISTLPETPNGAPVSEPERALLELLDAVGSKQGVEEAHNLFENLYSLRRPILQKLLCHCRQKKVVRLCQKWATELKFDWAENLLEDTANNHTRTHKNITV